MRQLTLKFADDSTTELDEFLSNLTRAKEDLEFIIEAVAQAKRTYDHQAINKLEDELVPYLAGNGTVYGIYINLDVARDEVNR